MSEIEIEKLFIEALQERGIYKSVGVDRTVISKWKTTPPTIGTMLQVLLKLDKIKVVKNG